MRTVKDCVWAVSLLLNPLVTCQIHVRYPAAKGNINPSVSGIGMAISEQVAKLEPNSTVPATICLYSGNK